jgi:hypothetical protein
LGSKISDPGFWVAGFSFPFLIMASSSLFKPVDLLTVSFVPLASTATVYPAAVNVFSAFAAWSALPKVMPTIAEAKMSPRL